MKKYIKPQTCTIELNAESMLAASKYEINPDKQTNEAWSEGLDSWDSENWGIIYCEVVSLLYISFISSRRRHYFFIQPVITLLIGTDYHLGIVGYLILIDSL